MQRVIAAIREQLDRGPMTDRGLEQVRRALQETYRDQGFRCVQNRHWEPGRYLCLKCDEYGFVGMLMVWEKGQATPIHDHGTWACEIVLQNQIKVTEYCCGEEKPEVVRKGVYGEGDVLSLLPPDGDVHKVEHHSGDYAVSFHIYGREMSWNRVYVPGEGFIYNQLETKYTVLPEQTSEQLLA